MSDKHTLREVLDRLAKAAGDDTVSVENLVDAIGHRAFPALILVPALIVTSPASGIPGLSSVGGITIAIVAAQYLWGRQSVWLPKFILGRTIPADKLRQVVDFLRRPAGWIDRVLKRRLTFLAEKPVSLALITAIMLLGLVMPLLELVPFSSSLIAGAISFLSLALLFRDGLLSLLGLALLSGGGYAVYAFLSS